MFVVQVVQTPKNLCSYITSEMRSVSKLKMIANSFLEERRLS